MDCASCGVPLAEGANFCPSCGYNVEAPKVNKRLGKPYGILATSFIVVFAWICGSVPGIVIVPSAKTEEKDGDLMSSILAHAEMIGSDASFIINSSLMGFPIIVGILFLFVPRKRGFSVST